MIDFRKRLLLPSLGDFIFVIIFLALIRLAPNFMFGDGGTGWHLATGKFIADTHSIPYTEFLSYTFAGKPWITQYWLSDLFMYIVERVSGMNGLAVLFAAGFAAIFLLVYDQCRKEGCTALLTSVLVILCALTASVQFLARPLIYTWFGVWLFALLLEKFESGELSARKLYIWLFGSSVLWANTHSGYIIGVTQVFIYLACNALFALVHGDAPARSAARTKSIQLSIALICVAVGVSLNPYGLALHANIIDALHNKAAIDSIQEFMSPSFHGGIQTQALELLLAGVVVAPFLSARRPSLARLLTVVAFGHLTLYSIRNAPVFAFVAAPFIAGMMAVPRVAEIFGPADQNPTMLRRLLNGVFNYDRKISTQEIVGGYHLLPVALVAVFFVSCLLPGSGDSAGFKLVNSGYSASEFPTATMETIKRLKLNPKEGFNDANWGGYLFYGAGLPVYIDDRSTQFGDFYVRYGKIVSLYPEWKELLKKDGINWVIFRKNTDFANMLASDPEWVLLDEDAAGVLFARVGSDAAKTRKR